MNVKQDIQSGYLYWKESYRLILFVGIFIARSICAESASYTPTLFPGKDPSHFIGAQYKSYLTFSDNLTLPSLGVLPSIRGIPTNYLWNEIGLSYSFLKRTRYDREKILIGVSLSYRTSNTEFVHQGRLTELTSSLPTDSGGYTRTTQIHQSAVTIIPYINWNVYKGIRLRVSAGLSIAIPSTIQDNITSDRELPISEGLTYSTDRKTADIFYTDSYNRLIHCVVGVGIERPFTIYSRRAFVRGWLGQHNIELIPSIYTEYQISLSKSKQNLGRDIISFGAGLTLQIPIDMLTERISRLFDLGSSSNRNPGIDGDDEINP